MQNSEGTGTNITEHCACIEAPLGINQFPTTPPLFFFFNQDVA